MFETPEKSLVRLSGALWAIADQLRDQVKEPLIMLISRANAYNSVQNTK
jgi:hypothetical protein